MQPWERSEEMDTEGRSGASPPLESGERNIPTAERGAGESIRVLDIHVCRRAVKLSAPALVATIPVKDG